VHNCRSTRRSQLVMSRTYSASEYPCIFKIRPPILYEYMTAYMEDEMEESESWGRIELFRAFRELLIERSIHSARLDSIIFIFNYKFDFLDRQANTWQWRVEIVILKIL
jgi:hypothetical protein